MATRAIPFRPASAAPRVPALAIDAVLMLAAAFALRCWWFGDPVVQVDEQFYRLVGDRMLHGAVPFVDIWDRKPVGLFLAYAAVAWLGGDGVLPYQLVATGLAAATAVMVVGIARLHAGGTAARLAGVAALTWMLVLDGAGGQSPVFYDPLMAGAALVALRAALDRRTGPDALVGAGCLAMLLVGVAIQFKYVALFEGIGLGCILLAAARDRGMAPLRLAGWAAAMAAFALLPTALAWGWYAAHGQGDAFLFANFRSIGRRAPIPLHSTLKKSAIAALELSPLIVAAVVVARRPAGDPGTGAARALIAAWLAAAVVGCLSIGVLDYHYMLPLTSPLAAFAAPAFEPADRAAGRPARWRFPLAVLVLGVALAAGLGIGRVRHRGDAAQYAQLAAAIRPRLHGCLYVYSGDPALYTLAPACAPTRFLFPSHLSNRSEAAAIGTDPVAEVARVMDGGPQLVVVSNALPKHQNWPTWRLLHARLARDYALVAAVPEGRSTRFLFQRRDAAPNSGGGTGGEQFQLGRS